jgi:hypothetical protein
VTAEIAIMNRHGIALAADSAVSIGYGGAAKIFNSVNKLFAGSKCAPVGIMVFGNALLSGVPWETVVKAFRQDLGERTFDTLAEYAEALVQFVETTPMLFSEQDELTEFESICISLCNALLATITGELHRDFEERGEVTQSEVMQTVSAVLISKLDEFSELHTVLESLPSGHGARVVQIYRERATALRDSIFEQIPLQDHDLEVFEQLLVSLVEAPPSGMANQAGLVVAGFGDSEFTPSLYEFELHGFLAGYLRRRTVRSSSIKSASDSVVLPFAQREMVDLFMTGIDPALKNTMTGVLDQLIEQLPEIISNNTPEGGGDGVAEAIRTSSSELVHAFQSQLEAQIDRDFVQPVLSATATLPKEELAAMAAALVNLTSFKRRVTLEAETVGGPIDVAIISKGDGLIWIHRKHYFEPALNHHFFANYFKYGEAMHTGEHA